MTQHTHTPIRANTTTPPTTHPMMTPKFTPAAVAVSVLEVGAVVGDWSVMTGSLTVSTYAGRATARAALRAEPFNAVVAVVSETAVAASVEDIW